MTKRITPQACRREIREHIEVIRSERQIIDGATANINGRIAAIETALTLLDIWPADDDDS